MYFNEKSDTDINKDISKSNNKKIKNNIFKKNKSYLIIGIFIIIFIISLILIFANRKEYYIDLSGEEYIKIYEGSEYIEDANGYYAYDSKGNDLTNEVEVTNNIDNNTIGEYTVTYKLHNVTKERYISVIEKPNIATYIHLKGDEVIYLSINEEYIDPGYIAIDTVDSNLTKKVKVTNNIDNTKAGIYKVTYSVTNSSGVTSSAVRKVIVMDSEVSLSLSNTNPTNSSVNINIHITDNYYSYLILPNNNKITSKDYSYKVSSNGEYKFTIYNTKGKSVTKSINVTNIDKEAPTGSCSGYTQDGKSYITVNATDNLGVSYYISNGVTNNGNVITLESVVTTPTVTIYDKAGNTKEITCTLEKKSPSSLVDLIPSIPSLKDKIDTSINTQLNYTETSYLLFGSDYQFSSDAPVSNFTSILNNVKNNNISPNLVGLLGDYLASSVTNNSSKIEEANKKIKNYFPNSSSIFIQGNHDSSYTKHLLASGGYIANNYALFSINYADHHGSDCTNDKKISEKLDTFLLTLKNNNVKSPVIVITHVPLHKSSRGGNSCSGYIFDVLQKYGDSLTIVFLYGHNHSHNYDNCIGGGMNYFAKGDSFTTYDTSKKGKTETLKFYYMNAGYVGYIRNTNGNISCSGKIVSSSNKQSMSLFTITNNHLSIDRYTKDEKIKVLDLNL